jgi:hypothetical protein
MSNFGKGVKKVPFDGTKENIYLWTTQLLGITGTYDCDQGTLTFPLIHLSTLDPNDPVDKILLAARKAKRTAMSLLCISLTNKISQSALYNFKTTELPGGSALKAWENLHKIFYPIIINKLNELKGEFVRSTLYKDDKNPDELFAEIYLLRQ